jgi:hypothetical protein
MIEGWHEFYALLGTGAAALVALLFVAVSVGAIAMTPERSAGTRTFMSPVVFHYSNILFLSLIMLVPGLTAKLLGCILVIAALGSLVYSIYTFVRVLRSDMADLADRLAYGSVPVVVYATGLVSSWLLFHDHAETGLNVLAGAALLLLLTNIRNAWDLMISLARRTAELARQGNGNGNGGANAPNPPPSP